MHVVDVPPFPLRPLCAPGDGVQVDLLQCRDTVLDTADGEGVAHLAEDSARRRRAVAVGHQLRGCGAVRVLRAQLLPYGLSRHLVVHRNGAEIAPLGLAGLRRGPANSRRTIFNLAQNVGLAQLVIFPRSVTLHKTLRHGDDNRDAEGLRCDCPRNVHPSLPARHDLRDGVRRVGGGDEVKHMLVDDLLCVARRRQSVDAVARDIQRRRAALAHSFGQARPAFFWRYVQGDGEVLVACDGLRQPFAGSGVVGGNRNRQPGGIGVVLGSFPVP